MEQASQHPPKPSSTEARRPAEDVIKCFAALDTESPGTEWAHTMLTNIFWFCLYYFLFSQTWGIFHLTTPISHLSSAAICKERARQGGCGPREAFSPETSVFSLLTARCVHQQQQRSCQHSQLSSLVENNPKKK